MTSHPTVYTLYCCSNEVTVCYCMGNYGLGPLLMRIIVAIAKKGILLPFAHTPGLTRWSCRPALRTAAAPRWRRAAGTPSPLDVLCPGRSEESMYGDYWNNTDVNGVTHGNQWHDTDMNTYTNLRTRKQLMHYTSAFFTHTHIMNLSLTN